jgi:magnesium-transporting ATPase (P-type)
MEEQPVNPASQQHYTEPVQQNLPNSTPVLVLGILSIVLSCWYFSFLGVILGIIALVLAGKDMTLYQSDPRKYTLSSFNNLKAGRTCAIIGLSVAVVFFVIMMLVIFGILATMPFWGMID